jgi:predicted O-linked N-acetylglucosamine transferase (SPINDLY family)
MNVAAVAQLQQHAQIQLQAGNLQHAAALLQQVLQIQRNNAPALSTLSGIAFAHGDTEAALGLAREAVRHAPKSADCLASLGRALRAAGQAEEAVSTYRRVLKIDPARADIQVSLAIALRALGRRDEAEAACRRATALAPGMAEAHHNLGNLLLAGGRGDEAETCYRRALELNPRLAEAWFELGNGAARAGDDAAAERCYLSAVEVRADYGRCWLHLARCRLRLVDAAGALEALRRAAALLPTEPEAHFELARVALAHGSHDESVLASRRALALQPEAAHGLVNLSLALRETGAREEAQACAERAMELDDALPMAWFALANLRLDAGNNSGAVEAYQRAIALEPAPGLAVFHTNLSNAYQRAGLPLRALEQAQRALERDATVAETHGNLGALHLALGDPVRAARHHLDGLARKPDSAIIRSNLCMVANHDEADDPARVLEAHRRHFGTLAERVERLPPRPSDGAAQRRLRVGYVSGDLRSHSVAFFLEPVLAAHDREGFEWFAYSTHARADAVTQRLRAKVDHWVEAAALDDAALAARVRADGIDILVDLAGHTGEHRLLAFARKPAPVQMSWLGYLSTTGVSAVDWRITDARVDPPGYEAFQVERPLRLPGCYVCYGAPAHAPAVAPLPQGPPVFASFNSLSKLGEGIVALWARLLREVPDARLLLKTRALVDPDVQALVRSRFAAHGIDPARLELCGWALTGEEHLATYGRVHVALDTWPYNGVTTTCEALWMGVPVVSLTGAAQAARQGLSLLGAVGLGELAVASQDVFVARAAQLVADRERLAVLRAGLRGRMTGSPLCDAPAFARKLESAYRQAWTDHVESAAASTTSA